MFEAWIVREVIPGRSEGNFPVCIEASEQGPIEVNRRCARLLSTFAEVDL